MQTSVMTVKLESNFYIRPVNIFANFYTDMEKRIVGLHNW